MPAIAAVYQGGVFRPLESVHFRENEQVTLNVSTSAAQDAAAWLAEVQDFQRKIIAERGYFPDSTADIAADRMRDE